MAGLQQLPREELLAVVTAQAQAIEDQTVHMAERAVRVEELTARSGS